MSSASPFTQSAPTHTPVRGVQLFQSIVLTPVQFVAFWAAIALPFILLGFVATGLAVEHAAAFGGLMLSNMVALRVGHGHKQD